MSTNWGCLHAPILLSLLCSLACGPGDGDGDDEVGEVTSVDDTADLDGTGTETTGSTETTSTESTDSTETSTGDSTETSTGDPTFEQLCTDGCTHFLECAPTEFAGLYADVGACESACQALYAGCTQEASEYFYCFLGLQCAQVLTAVTEGPDATECGPAYAAANAACGG